jgi:hypothetical protein
MGLRMDAVPEAGAPIQLRYGFRNIAVPEAGAPRVLRRADGTGCRAEVK